MIGGNRTYSRTVMSRASRSAGQNRPDWQWAAIATSTCGLGEPVHKRVSGPKPTAGTNHFQLASFIPLSRVCEVV